MRREIAACFRLSISGPPKSRNENLEAVIILIRSCDGFAYSIPFLSFFKIRIYHEKGNSCLLPAVD